MNDKTKKEYNTYLVTDEELLYRLASCCLLDKLCSVAPNRYVNGARVWFFDKDTSVGDVIHQYNAEKQAKTDECRKNQSSNVNKKNDQVKCDGVDKP